MVQRTAARGISQQGRSATGVRVMNMKEEDRVSAIALVVEGEADVTEVADVTDPAAAAPPEDLDVVADAVDDDLDGASGDVEE
jgi:DNA gyrase subunit A